MFKLHKVLSLLVLLALLVCIIVLPAQATRMDYSFNATVGQLEYLIIFSDAYDEITDAYIYNGVIPGMWLEVSGGATLGLAGTPTTEGEFSVFITATTQKLGTVDIKVTVTVQSAENSSAGTPVVTKNPTGETVVEGESAAFVARADNTRQYQWQIAIADAQISCADLPSYIGGGVKVSGLNSDTLVLSNIPKSLNDAYIWCQFVGAETSVNSEAAKLTVIAKEDAKPVVTQNPADAAVEEGAQAAFTAQAKYAQKYSWQLISPDGVTYDAQQAQNNFKPLQITGADTDTVTLSNIPASLDGYSLCCAFTAGETVYSEKATLQVSPKATEPTEPAPTQPPTEATEEPVNKESGKEKPMKGSPGEQEQDLLIMPAPAGGEDPGGNGLIIIVIIAAAAVLICGIAAVVIIKLKGNKKQ